MLAIARIAAEIASSDNGAGAGQTKGETMNVAKSGSHTMRANATTGHDLSSKSTHRPSEANEKTRSFVQMNAKCEICKSIPIDRLIEWAVAKIEDESRGNSINAINSWKIIKMKNFLLIWLA